MQKGQLELLVKIASLLEKIQVSYMVTGAWSVIFYARPRSSHDIDFIIELFPEDVPKIIEGFKKLPYDFFFQEEAIYDAIKNNSLFNILCVGFIKVDFWLLKDDSFDRERFQRREKKIVLSEIVRLATAEDTILQKLRWYQITPIEKHLIDAAFVYQVQKDDLDFSYLKKWAKELKVTRLLNKLPAIDLTPHI